MALKNEWKETGVNLGHAFRDLGKAVVKTVKVGIDKADEWASGEETRKAETQQSEEKSE